MAQLDIKVDKMNNIIKLQQDQELEESFGNSTFVENAKKTELAINKVEKTYSVFNHSNSQFSWKYLVLHHPTPARNIRQISAEIKKKHMALMETKWRFAEQEIELEEIQKRLANQENDKRLTLTESKINEQMAMSKSSIEGAMKDIILLSEQYDCLVEKYKDYNEEDFEAEEVQYHLSRALLQSTRDIRQFGTIRSGNQEYLEQIGLNPTKIFIELRGYFEDETAEPKNVDWGVSSFNGYIKSLAEKLTPYVKLKLEDMGFDHNPSQDALMKR